MCVRQHRGVYVDKCIEQLKSCVGGNLDVFAVHCVLMCMYLYMYVCLCVCVCMCACVCVCVCGYH
jgi:hypothetical protein